MVWQCFFELVASALVKDVSLRLCQVCGWAYRHNLSEQMRRQRIQQRIPPLSPIAFASEMKKRVEAGQLKFTATADMEVVIEQYRVGFVKAIEEHAGMVFLWHLGWGDIEGAALLEAVQYAAANCQRTEQLCFSLNSHEVEFMRTPYTNSFSVAMEAEFKAFNEEQRKTTTGHPMFYLFA